VEELQALPGIGRYTAGAVASIAYGVRAPVLDGNVARVLGRLAAMDEDVRVPRVRDRLWVWTEALLPARRCGDFNQALMELGATVCLPRSPDCPGCPLKADCRAFGEGSADRIPPAARRARVVGVKMVVAAVRRGRQWLFLQRPHRGLWAGLWELPSEPVGAGESESEALDRLRARLPAGVTIDSLPCGQLSWRLTHREIHFALHAGRCDRNGSRGSRVAD